MLLKLQLGTFTCIKNKCSMVLVHSAISGPESDNSEIITSYFLFKSIHVCSEVGTIIPTKCNSGKNTYCTE